MCNTERDVIAMNKIGGIVQRPHCNSSHYCSCKKHCDCKKQPSQSFSCLGRRSIFGVGRHGNATYGIRHYGLSRLTFSMSGTAPSGMSANCLYTATRSRAQTVGILPFKPWSIVTCVCVYCRNTYQWIGKYVYYVLTTDSPTGWWKCTTEGRFTANIDEVLAERVDPAGLDEYVVCSLYSWQKMHTCRAMPQPRARIFAPKKLPV